MCAVCNIKEERKRKNSFIFFQLATGLLFKQPSNCLLFTQLNTSLLLTQSATSLLFTEQETCLLFIQLATDLLFTQLATGLLLQQPANIFTAVYCPTVHIWLVAFGLHSRLLDCSFHSWLRSTASTVGY